MVRRCRPRRGARPRRSLRWARPGGPRSSASTMVKLAPDTASVWVRSVSLNASSSSGVTRAVSPTTRPGSSARASAGRSSVASRRPARNRPASRCAAEGSDVRSGGCRPVRTRSTAAMRSPRCLGGESRAVTRSRVVGSRLSQREGAGSARDRSPCAPTSTSTSTRTGVLVVTVRPSPSVTRRTSASISTVGGTARSPRTRGRVRRGSAVTSTSAVTVAYRRASSGTGPLRRSAPCSAAEAADAAMHRRTAAATGAWGRPRLAGPSRKAPASSTPAATTPTAQPAGTSGVSAAVAQAARAGGTRRRSAGPSCRGWAAPSRWPEAACTAARGGLAGGSRGPSHPSRPSGGSGRTGRTAPLTSVFMAVRGLAGRRSGVRRCR